MTGFDGFRPEAATFLRGLRQNNSKAWFDAHRDEYTEFVRQPMELLLGEAEQRYGSGRVLRPNRDVRFSPDKSPYRTTAGMWAGGVGGVYLQLSPEGLEVGGGLYEPSTDQLTRGRRAIDGRPKAAADLRAVVDRLEKAGYKLAGPSLATAPRGYARDHPDIALLRLKHYAALAPLPLDASRQRILGAWQRVEPLLDWVERWVGADAPQR